MTLSPQIRLFALVGGLAAAALAGAMFFLSRPAAADDTPLPMPAPRVHRQTAPAPVQPKPKPRAASVIAENGLPVAIASKLAANRIVVAALYAGGATVDTLARDEARAGASDARAGFAAVDVSDKRIALALAERAQTLTAPSVLVFGRDGELKARLDGFADRQLIAQLVSSAR